MSDAISLPTPYAAARVAAFLAEHLSWTAFWDKREGVWRVSEHDPDIAAHRGSAAAMLRSGRIRARTPPLVSSTGISRQGCGARVTACPRCGSTPRRGLKLEPW